MCATVGADVGAVASERVSDHARMPARAHPSVPHLVATLRSVLAASQACPQCERAPAGPDGPCGRCRSRALAPVRDGDVVQLGGYGSELGRLVRAAKFAGWDRALDHLVAALASGLDGAIEGRPELARAPLVAVPSHEARRRARTVHLASHLARALAAQRPRHRAVEALRRRRNDPARSSLRRAERDVGMADAFEVRPPWTHVLRGRTVVVVDDVLTTGSTLRSVRAALGRYGVAVGLVVVVAGPGGARPRPGGDATLE